MGLENSENCAYLCSPDGKKVFFFLKLWIGSSVG